MQINQATDYSFRAALFLAAQSDLARADAQTIAREEKIPMRYLLKIMPALIKAGIVKSYRGIGGGYALNGDPAHITLLDILEAVEGPIALNRCLLDPALCSKEGPPHCKIHQALYAIQQRLEADLRSYTLKELSDQAPTWTKMTKEV